MVSSFVLVFFLLASTILLVSAIDTPHETCTHTLIGGRTFTFVGQLPSHKSPTGKTLEQDFHVRVAQCSDCGRAIVVCKTVPYGEHFMRLCALEYAYHAMPMDVREDIDLERTSLQRRLDAMAKETS